LEAKLSKASSRNDYLEKKIKSLAKNLAKARATPLLSLSDKVPARKAAVRSHTDPGIVDDAFANYIDAASKPTPTAASHHATFKDDDEDESSESSDGSSEVRLTYDPHYEPGDQLSMDQKRKENSKIASEMVKAHRSGKEIKVSFTLEGKYVDDGSEDWFDPRFQVEEENRQRARVERKNSLAADLRDRIKQSRSSRSAEK
jgi:hypothetical protein